MKVLYGIQCTGNGHISRSVQLIKELQQHVQVDIITSGKHSELKIPLEVKYACKGLSYYFGTKGSFDLYKTMTGNSLRQFIKDVRNLPVQAYDMIISDFEPISSWAAHIRDVYSVSLCNQAALLFNHVEKPDLTSPVSKFIIKAFIPGHKRYGLHYQNDGRFLFNPPIKDSLKNQPVFEGDTYLVYLPFYGDKQIIAALSRFDVKWKVFSKHCKAAYSVNNMEITPIHEVAFDQALLTCKGILCSAGFGTTSEALYLRKNLLVMPMKNQYEQQCNAFSLRNMGIEVIESLGHESGPNIEKWLHKTHRLPVCMFDESKNIIRTILSDYIAHREVYGQFASA